ncbi:MAG: hypothetical protein QM640_01695 [Niabella sp.]
MSNSSDSGNYDALADMPKNRVLFAGQFTTEAPLRPGVVHELQTLEQVFRYYKPVINFLFEDKKGFTRLEELKFTSLDDFSLNGITAQSSFLRNAAEKKKNYLKIAREINANARLKEVLADSKARTAFATKVEELINELKNTKL